MAERKKEQKVPLFVKITRNYQKAEKRKLIKQEKILDQIHKEHKVVSDLGILEHEEKYFEELKKRQEDRKKE